MRSAVITCFFNAMDYESRRLNYAAFAARLKKQKVPLYTIEAVFPGQRSSLTGFANIETITCETVLWQKESLLNALIRKLDRKYEGIIWCDADILFENAGWYRQVCRLLDKVPVVQPFACVARLPRGKKRYVRSAELYTSFGSVYAKKPQLLTRGDFAAHGHTGFAWAARRDMIGDLGLYDAMIAGSGDHVMAHAFAGDFSSECIRRILANNPKHIEHFTQWARAVYPHVRGRIGALPGRILHLWHGETANRRYVERNRELASFGFDPARDLVRDERGLWKWGRQRRPLAVWAKNYFALRREDG
ncbi:MAG: hypothetical protein U1F16_09805 [Turneriella sp.]